MASRMERLDEKIRSSKSRIARNQELYQEIKDYSDYKEITSIEPVIESSTDFVKKEVKYEEPPRMRPVEKEVVPSIFMVDEKREYDINTALQNAKESRIEVDALEEKRNLKKPEYNIIQEIGLEKIEETIEKRQRPTVEEEQELTDLIDTIYQNTLASDIEKQEEAELLGDLLPTEKDNTIISEELTKMMIEEERKAKKIEEQEENPEIFMPAVKVKEVQEENQNVPDIPLESIQLDEVREELAQETPVSSTKGKALSQVSSKFKNKWKEKISQKEEQNKAKEKLDLDASFFTMTNELSAKDLVDGEGENKDEWDDEDGGNPKVFLVQIVLAVVVAILVVIYLIVKGV